MKTFKPKSAVEQLADHLREEILSGSIGETMPGVNHLVKELGMGTNTVLAAMAALEKEGLLENQGGRRSRKVVRNSASRTAPGVKVEILLYEKGNAREGFLVDLLHKLQNAGHTASFSSKSLLDLGMETERVARHVRKSGADAWVVFVGSKPVLEWFAAQPFPSFALLGRGNDVPMASLTVSKTSAMSDILRRLVAGGHRRIVLISHEERRKPYPGLLERHFLAELEQLGISTGPYNLPDWGNDPESYQNCLASLFAKTPPTAILFDEPFLYLVAQPFLNHRLIQIPKDLSIIVLDAHPAFAWSHPAPFHLATSPGSWVTKVMRWVNRVSGGKTDHRKIVSNAKIVEGETIGKARY